MTENFSLNRQAIRSQNMLQEALIVLLDEKPYDKITIADIIRQANLTRPTFYAHYDTKDDLLTCLIDEMFQSFFEAFYETVKIEPLNDGSMIASHTKLFEQLQEKSNIYQAIRNAGKVNVISEKLIAFHTMMYEEAISSSEPDMKPALANLFISHTSRTTITLLNYWFDQGMIIPVETMAKILSTLAGPTTLTHILEEFAAEFDY